MSLVQAMRGQLKDAMKARDTLRLSVLRYWIAQLTLGTGEEVSDADAVKKMRSVLKEAKTGQTTFSPEEVALIQEWVPASLGVEAIAEVLAPVRDAIKAAPKDGVAMGLAMKALAGRQVEAEDVKAAVATIRQGE